MAANPSSSTTPGTWCPPVISAVSRYQDRIDLGYEFSQTLMKKLANAVTPLGVSPPESFDGKLVYIMGNTTCEPKPGNALSPGPEAVRDPRHVAQQLLVI